MEYGMNGVVRYEVEWNRKHAMYSYTLYCTVHGMKNIQRHFAITVQ